MSADDVRIAEALEDIAGSLTTIAEYIKKNAPDLSYLESISNRLGGFTAFLEDYAKHNFD